MAQHAGTSERKTVTVDEAAKILGIKGLYPHRLLKSKAKRDSPWSEVDHAI
jgi:hypothetical protein